MGNCLTNQTKVIKIMKTDGKILEYKAPITVHQVLSEFTGHVLSDRIQGMRYLKAETDLVGGHLYYLLPLPITSLKNKKKKVRFSEENEGERSGVVRIKMVITKQELIEMLRNGGVSVNGLPLKIPEKDSTDDEDNEDDGDGSNKSRGWKPLLESIPELN